ncbi:hypothetical protein [Propionivibrio sp.]|uniref:hypothetical protein n=1 Tax=Propionivibrio sp. TaxID=2212460 RepID=UPI003BF1A2B0
MSSNAKRQSQGCDGHGENTVLDEFPVFSSAHFICAEPRWLGTALRGLLLLSGLGIAYIATTAPNLPSTINLLLWIASGLAILGAIMLSPDSIHYASDPQGVYFPSRERSGIFGPSRPQTWLFVPWSNITSLCASLLLNESGNTKGVIFSLRASEEERRVYFTGTTMPTHDKGLLIGDRSTILVGFPSAFKSPYKIAELLHSFRRLKATPCNCS